MHKKCAVTEKESLLTVKTLKEFCTILLRHKTNIFTDHKTLICKTHDCKRITWWCSLLKDHCPNFVCVPGKKNVAANALSRLDIMTTDIERRKLNQVLLCDITNKQEMTHHCDPNPSCVEQCQALHSDNHFCPEICFSQQLMATFLS